MNTGELLRPIDVKPVYGGEVVRTLLFAAPEEPGRHVIRVAMAVAHPGGGGQLHRHPDTTEVYFVIGGQGFVDVGGRRIGLSPNLCIEIPRNTPHRIRCFGDEPLRYLALHIADQDFAGPVHHLAEDVS